MMRFPYHFNSTKTSLTATQKEAVEMPRLAAGVASDWEDGKVC